MIEKARLWILAAAACVLLAVGMWMGKIIWTPKPAGKETAAPAVRQKDGSLILERKETDPNVKPKVDVPPGWKLVREIQIDIKPQGKPSNNSSPSHSPDASGLVAHAGVNPLLEMPTQLPSSMRMDLSIFRVPDGSLRVIAPSGENYTVIGGTDQPVEPMSQPSSFRNSFGVSGKLAGGGIGLIYTRNIGERITLGAQVIMRYEKSLNVQKGTEAWLTASWRF